MSMGGRWKGYRHGKNEVLGEKPVPVPFCPTHIPHIPPWDWNRAYSVSDCWLTAGAMAWPLPKATFALHTRELLIRLLIRLMSQFECLDDIYVHCHKRFDVYFLPIFKRARKIAEWLLALTCLSFRLSICLPPTCLSDRRFVHLSVPPHGTARLPLERYSWNFIFEYFSKSCPEESSFIITWQE
jgi:hypothetical protein